MKQIDVNKINKLLQNKGIKNKSLIMKSIRKILYKDLKDKKEEK